MTEPKQEPAEPVRNLPRPIVKKMRWPFPLIWVVPLIAAGIAGYYYWQHVRDEGPEIVLKFADGSGLRAGQTPVTHRGVPVGKITNIELSADQKQVLVHVRLTKANSAIARQGSSFWVVRPEISGLSITGLGTVVSGPYIEAIPGNGEPVNEFTGLERAPVASGDGLVVILRSPELEHLSDGAPVTYRGIQVGAVQASQLNFDATQVDIFVLIWSHYNNLVHTDTQFWSVSGLDVKGGVFTGVKAKIDSLGALVTGGVAFATPDDGKGQPVQTGAEFVLNAESKKEWLKWLPKIPLGAGESVTAAEAKDVRAQVKAAEVPTQVK